MVSSAIGLMWIKRWIVWGPRKNDYYSDPSEPGGLLGLAKLALCLVFDVCRTDRTDRITLLNPARPRDSQSYNLPPTTRDNIATILHSTLFIWIRPPRLISSSLEFNFHVNLTLPDQASKMPSTTSVVFLEAAAVRDAAAHIWLTLKTSMEGPLTHSAVADRFQAMRQSDLDTIGRPGRQLNR
jgi:hypothetical protein